MKKLSSLIVSVICATLMVHAAPMERNKAGTVIVPITANPNYHRNIHTALDRIRKKRSKWISSNHLVKKDGIVPMINYENLEFIGSVYIGTPPVKYDLDFDTGSSDLWIPSTTCTTCVNKTTYNPNQSSSYVKEGKPFQLSYLDKSNSSGITGLETITIGGLTIKNQRFGMVTEESAAFSKSPDDGLLGLAFNSLSVLNDTKTPLDNMISQGLISKPVFGVYLGSLRKEGGGEYVFGGYNQSKISGPLINVNVDVKSGGYGVKLKNLNIGNTTIPGSSAEYLVDTGSTLLILDKSTAAIVAKAYGTVLNNDGQTYNISCDPASVPSLSLTIDGFTAMIPSEDVIYANDHGRCVAGFTLGSSSNYGILGDLFLRNVYTVFDQGTPALQFGHLA
ncbi:rhizopuspepsinogen precursor [Halteromyces radiatus]|uniref:rhizopuspepsinogen precursor n=1 Tax=Halteromyces radiatus TaxID=101107 RepID=UPI00221E86B6|nr:rhizopuspepsinogen precursor [Halteromyces radiatus]KAI8081404.1 rhizopuspepsinogen precursor [Halteromyces radiatus]